MSMVGNVVLNIWMRRWQATTGLEIIHHEGTFDDEFLFSDEQRKNEGIHSRRAAADLNWRYRDDLPYVSGADSASRRRIGWFRCPVADTAKCPAYRSLCGRTWRHCVRIARCSG